MVDVFYNTIDGTGQFSLIVQFNQMPEMISVLIVFKRMLGISCNGAVHIFICALCRFKSLFIIVMLSTQHHCAAIADILINSLNTKHPFIFPVGDQGCVKHHAAIIELFTF